MKNILIVEDSRLIREEIRDILIMENFEVIEAVNGIEGLDVAMNFLPDLILSDISMPELDGFELLFRLRNNIRTENIPVIFLSAKSELQDIRKGMNIGADDYLTKPVCADDLIAAVRVKLELKSKNENKLNSFKSHIAQHIPHELITPLNGILGLSDYLRDFHPIDEVEIISIANSIHCCGERLYNLIENYLMYTKLLSEFYSPLEKHPDRSAIFVESIELIDVISKILPQNRVGDLVFSVENVNIRLNKRYYWKIVEELIRNSIKFSKPGNKIRIGSFTNQDKYFFQVESFGSGISKKQIEEIGAFVQFDRDVNEQQGVGLGLEIVRLIVEISGGHILIDSKPDDFFKVTVEIPFV
jgi:two-component system, sensor histidine kinase and response regulator